MKFRKKPVVIEAIKLCWENWNAICEFANVGYLKEGKPEGCYIGPDGKPREGHEASDKIGILIPTLEGLMVGTEGDWLIRGVKGELYPCKPDIFDATYEKVDE